MSSFQNLKKVDDRTITFTMSPTHVTYANSLRRSVQTEVSILGVRSDITETGTTSDVVVIKNSTPMSNEMLADRVGLLPFWYDPMTTAANWEKEKILFKLHVKNETDQVRLVTASDFECLELIPEEERDEQERRRIPNTRFFHPDPVTAETAIIAVLKPQLEGQEPEEIHLEAFASFGKGREHTRFNPASQCAYRYTRDETPERIAALWITWLREQKKVDPKDLDALPERKEMLEREFRSLEIYRCFKQDEQGEPNSYDFTVETVGPMMVQGIVYYGLLGVAELADKYSGDLPETVDIRPADWASPDGFDVWFTNEDHTLGNLLQTWISENKADVFVGYKVPHPLRPEMILRLGVKEDSEVRSLISEAATAIGDMFRSWADEWITNPALTTEGLVAPVTPEFARGQTPVGVVVDRALPPWKAHEKARLREGPAPAAAPAPAPAAPAATRGRGAPRGRGRGGL